MKVATILLIALSLLGVVVCSGCIQIIRWYKGPLLNPSETAGLSIGHRTSGVSAELAKTMQLEVDGEPVIWDPNGGDVFVQILPGLHKIKWTLSPKNANFTYRGEGSLDAERGKSYLFGFACLKGRRSAGQSYRTAFGWAYPYSYEIKETATWIEKYIPFKQAIVLVGTRPK